MAVFRVHEAGGTEAGRLVQKLLAGPTNGQLVVNVPGLDPGLDRIH